MKSCCKHLWTAS